MITGTFNSTVFANTNGHGANFETEINPIEGLQKGIKDFPIKTIFDIKIKTNDSIIKKFGESNYLIREIKKENGVIFYNVGTISSSDSFLINVSEKTKEIIAFEYYLFDTNDLNDSNYYGNTLPIITNYYGDPTKVGYTNYQNKNYNYAQFYEKNKYEYYFGLSQDITAPGYEKTRFIYFKVHAL